jgi:hypothetical protein
VDVRAGVGDDAVVPLFLRPITLHRDDRMRRNPERNRDGLQNLEAWVTRFMLSMAKDSGVAIIPNLSRAPIPGRKYPALLTADNYHILSALEVLSQEIRTRFGQP